MFEVPEILKGLYLYEKDEKLCTKIMFSISSWAKAYPLVDIKSQIGWAHAWEVSNPTRQKKDRIRFLNNWMATNQERREQERRTGERRAPDLPKPKHYDVNESDVMSGEDFANMRRAIRERKRKNIGDVSVERIPDNTGKSTGNSSGIQDDFTLF